MSQGYAPNPGSPPSAQTGPPLAGLLAKSAVSLSLLCLLLLTADIADLVAVLRDFSPWYFFSATAVLLLQAPVLGLRWHRIIRVLGGDVPLARAVRIGFVGVPPHALRTLRSSTLDRKPARTTWKPIARAATAGMTTRIITL